MNKYKNSIKYFALMSLTSVGVMVLSLNGFVYAQSPQDLCPDPGTSQYAACVTETNQKLSQCDTSFSPGTSLWQDCKNQVIADLQPVDENPVANDENQNNGNDSGDENGNTSIDTDCNDAKLTRKNCGIVNLLVIGINVLSAIAGIAIIASIMIAGFMYMTAQDDPSKVQKAKSRIVMALVALSLFIFMYALLNFLVPGGVL